MHIINTLLLAINFNTHIHKHTTFDTINTHTNVRKVEAVVVDKYTQKKCR